jgi:hypothetical protein
MNSTVAALPATATSTHTGQIIAMYHAREGLLESLEYMGKIGILCLTIYVSPNILALVLALYFEQTSLSFEHPSKWSMLLIHGIAWVVFIVYGLLPIVQFLRKNAGVLWIKHSIARSSQCTCDTEYKKNSLILYPHDVEQKNLRTATLTISCRLCRQQIFYGEFAHEVQNMYGDI